MKLSIVFAAAVCALSMVTAGAGAAEIRVFSSNALKTVLGELGPQFERASGHTLVYTYNTAAALKTEIEKGAAFDVAFLSSPATDDLVKQGRLAAGTRADVARSGAGVAIRKGAARPDLSTTDAFKRALLNAKSITYVEQGATGLYLKGLFGRLGIAEELQSRTKFIPASISAAQAVANGDAEIGMTQISEILPYPGAELAGPLPPDIQLYTVFPAAVSSNARDPDAANALIRFVRSPAAGAVIRAKGLEPL